MEATNQSPEQNDQAANNPNQRADDSFDKADMLDLSKSAAAMDKLDIPFEGVGGSTIGGVGSGPGTGDTGGDFDRPGTDGRPDDNDYVSSEPLGITEEDRIVRDAEGDIIIHPQDLPGGSLTEGAEASGYPGGGAVRTAEDRLPPGEIDEDAGFSPESPLNQ